MDFFKIREIIQSHLTENAAGAYRVTVPAADALQANEVASDRFRGEYSMEGSNVFIFDSMETAKEFADALDMNGLESFMESVNEKELKKKKDDPCWDGYVQVGMKKKNGKEVPNCVPMDEALQEAQKRFGIQSLTEKKKNVDQLEVGDSILMGSEDTPYKIVSIKKADTDGPGTYYDAEVEGPDGKKKTKLSGQVMMNEKKSGGDDAYEKFFNKALDKFGVDDPSELSKEKKKEFFDYVDKNWKGDDE